MKLFDRFPSYEYLLAGAGRAFKRFPLTLISAAIGVVVAVILVDKDQAQGMFLYHRMLVTGALGISLFFSLAVWAEKKQKSAAGSFGIQAIGIVLLILYYISLPHKVFDTIEPIVRFLLLGIGLHFLAAFLPYLGKDQTNGFWQYNKSLFLRFLFSALYSAVLYVGLAIALLAADKLFGVDVKEARYFQLWIIMAGLVNTWIFLSGIPGDLAELNNNLEYPKALKVFSQYVLLPLVLLYFIILIAYEAKIVFTWNWPRGWVSNLVLWYSVVGILSTLLLYPFQKNGENRWIAVFSRWFFRGLIPLVIMLFLAIFKRISDYGITENRYFVLAMAVGLAVTVIYFILSRKKDIRVIPIIIFCLAFLSAYGPQSAFSVSEKAQKGHLIELLTKNEMLANDALLEISGTINFEDRKEMSALVSYLVEWHGIESFGEWLDKTELAKLDTLGRVERSEKICELIGFQYISHWRSTEEDEYFSLNISEDDYAVTTGYDYLVNIDSKYSSEFERSLIIGNDSCFVSFNQDDLIIAVGFKDNPENIELSLAPLFAYVDPGEERQIPQKDLVIAESGADYKIMLVIFGISGRANSDGISRINNIKGNLLIGNN